MKHYELISIVNALDVTKATGLDGISKNTCDIVKEKENYSGVWWYIARPFYEF